MPGERLHLRKHIKKVSSGEDFCYVCGLGGTLVECECCPRAYHVVCLGDVNYTESEFFQCPWHTCDLCNTNNAKYIDQISIVCTKCPTSYCPTCVPESVSKRLRDSEVSQPTLALYDIHATFMKKCCIAILKESLILMLQDGVQASYPRVPWLLCVKRARRITRGIQTKTLVKSYIK